MNTLELLAPAGDMAAFKAAADNGADAIYFGTDRFSARKHAANFTLETAKRMVAEAHACHMKAYCTVNTLIYNHEVGELVEVLSALAEMHVDALIVQDLGVAALVREAFPELRLHASTQMTVHNSTGVQQLAALGFERVVLSRECSGEDLAAISENTDTDTELEVFVHGAQCVCYSGACLMSSMLGGRSGNRGDCAQPCRMPYTLTETDANSKTTNKAVEGPYLLSPKDMDLLPFLPQLHQRGITSLKIEGRMKKPEYVAATVRAYRTIIDLVHRGEMVDPQTLQQHLNTMTAVFNRGGNGIGYYAGNPGRDLMFYESPKNIGTMLGRIITRQNNRLRVQLLQDLKPGDGYAIYDKHFNVLGGGYVNQITFVDPNHAGTEAHIGDIVQLDLSPDHKGKATAVYKTFDHALSKALRKNPLKRTADTTTLDMLVVAFPGAALRLQAVTADGQMIEIVSDYIVQEAANKPTTEADMHRQLGRLGDTPFILGRFQLKGGNDVFVPASTLNQIRRDAVATLMPEEVPQSVPEPVDVADLQERAFDWLDRIPPEVRYDKIPQLAVRVATLAQAETAIAYDIQQLIIEPLKYEHGNSTYDPVVLKSIIDVCEQRRIQPVLGTGRIWHEQQLPILKTQLEAARNFGITAVEIQNLGAVLPAKAAGFTDLYGGYGLNVTNDLSIRALMEAGFVNVTLSPELSQNDIQALSYIGNMPLTLTVYGDIPLMISAHCIPGAAIGGRTTERACRMPCVEHRYRLVNAQNKGFQLRHDGLCHMYVVDDRVLDLSSELNALRDLQLDRWALECIFMTPNDIDIALKRITGDASQPRSPRPTMRGHF